MEFKVALLMIALAVVLLLVLRVGKRKDEEKEVVKKTEPRFNEDARWFDESCLGWHKDPEMNKMFLLMQQNYFNDKLRARGYLFLNEVYDALGIPRTARGQVVGWVYTGEYPFEEPYVDLGLYAEHNRAFINGTENKVLLTFNVDGDILKYL